MEKERDRKNARAHEDRHIPSLHQRRPYVPLLSGQTGSVRFVEWLVDALPKRLWAPGNLYMLPGGDWHFCKGPHPGSGEWVRTVEWRGRQVARGGRLVPVEPEATEELDIGEFVGFGRWGYYPGDRRP